MNRAVFLDRDGVLIEDSHLLTRADQLRLLPGVPAALHELQQAGYRLIVVSNQPVVARGLISEKEVEKIHEALAGRLIEAGAPPIDGWYFCPHHPHATVMAYRLACQCRKPRPGLFLAAAREREIALPRSYAVGDRLTDVLAGAQAGCRTILVQTGKHLEPLIETVDPIDTSIAPDYTGADLAAAAAWILKQH